MVQPKPRAPYTNKGAVQVASVAGGSGGSGAACYCTAASRRPGPGFLRHIYRPQFYLDTQTPLGTDTTLILQDAKAGVLN